MPDDRADDLEWQLSTSVEQPDLFNSFTDKEFGLTLLADFDYEAQLAAVRSLLRRQQSSDRRLEET